MIKFSDKIKESQNTKTYKYKISATIEGTVTATSDGDAGELVDKEMDEYSNITNYNIDSLDVSDEKPEINESLIDPIEKVKTISESVENDLTKIMNNLNHTEMIYFKENLNKFINK